VDPRSSRTTFREYADDWLSSQVHRESTAALYKRHLHRHAYPVLGDRQLGSILPTTIQAWVKGLSIDDLDRERSALAPSTIGVVYTVVASIFRAAVRDRKLASSPCNGVTLPKIQRTRV